MTREVAARSVKLVTRSVVCISRAVGAGGEDVGWAVAKRLGFLYVDEDVIARAAARGGVDIERVADEERRKSLVAGLLERLAEAGGAAVVAAPPRVASDQPGSEAVRAFIRDAINEVADRGNAVIVAHAASFAVGPGPRALRVLITAPPETRSKRLAVSDGLSGQDAAQAIRRSDLDRIDYLKRFYDVSEELPVHYDMVVNTDTISVDEAADLIVQAATGWSADAVGAASE